MKEIKRVGFSGNILSESEEYVAFELEGLPVEVCKLDGVLCFLYQPEKLGEELAIPCSEVENLEQLKLLLFN